MIQTMEYKGYTGSIEFSVEDDLYCGSVLGIRDSITFDGKTLEDLEADFHETIDFYLSYCEEAEKIPDIPDMSGDLRKDFIFPELIGVLAQVAV